MRSSGDTGLLRLRPHHIFCDRFLPLDGLVRGEEFARAVNEIQELTRPGSDVVVIVTEGPDQLCDSCPDYRNERCENPMGDEGEVRKWDARVRQGLGLSYGDELSVPELLVLIKKKAPLDFCRDRCPWKKFCGVFGQ